MKISEIKNILREMNFTPSKFRGQSFLLNEETAKRIVEALEIKPYDKIIEIGPGLGMLTKYLIQPNVIIYGIEIEKEFCHYLNRMFPGLECIHQDFLKIEEFENFNKIIGNIPYIRTNEILYKILHFESLPEIIVLTVQKEVGERLVSKPGNKNYSSLSVLFQTFFDCKYLFSIHKRDFYPQPKVSSAVIKMRMKENIGDLGSKYSYIQFVKHLFKQRRRTIKNNLIYAGYKEKDIKEILTQNNISLNARPETLTYKEIINLYNKLGKRERVNE